MATFNHDPLGQARFDAPTSPTTLTTGTEGFLIDLAPGRPLYTGIVSPALTTYLGPALPLVGTFTGVVHEQVTILSLLEVYLTFNCDAQVAAAVASCEAQAAAAAAAAATAAAAAAAAAAAQIAALTAQVAALTPPPVVLPSPTVPPSGPPPSSGFLNPGNSGITYRKRIYVHKYFFRNTGSGGERVQSSWSHWEFSGVSEILQILVIEEVLYLLMEYPNGEVWLERMRVSDRAVDDDSLQPLLLDRRVSTTEATPSALRVAAGTYDAFTDTTTWTLPYQAAAPVQAWSGYGSEGAWEEGVRIATTETGATAITANGNWSGADVFFGEAYEFFYEFTRFKAMREIGGGKVAMNEMRTQIRRAHLRFHETGYFEALVQAEGRPESIHRFTANGPEGEGVFIIPIMSEGRRARVRLRNDTARPCKFTTCEWVGTIAGRARGMQ
jgi:hypothetical protein